ncbi:hypothetical protein AB833_04415 [Chromatiales bacterium (ex Bugula neritina AB1)]|nr:hypothetical protein AB833_04415 [Chromatiales bacterium (ex Bugula neritina AB1)]
MNYSVCDLLASYCRSNELVMNNYSLKSIALTEAVCVRQISYTLVTHSISGAATGSIATDTVTKGAAA